MPRRVPPVAQNLLLSVLSVVVFAGAVEGVCRLLEAKPEPRPSASNLIVDWLAWQGEFYTVNSTAVGWPPWEDFNRDGVRDREHTLAKPPGVRRVVVLGDSVTLGYGLPPDQAYPQLMQDRIDALGGQVEVLNVALWGWSTRQERIAYERIARKYAPDQVLVGFCLNDIAEMQNNLARPAPALAWLHAHSALARRLVGAHQREVADLDELFTASDSSHVREGYRRTLAELRVLRDLVQRDGASFGLVILPMSNQVSSAPPPPRPQQTLEAFCRDEAIPYLDVLPALRPLGESAFTDHLHLSARGTHAVAQAILAAGLVAVDGATSPSDGPTSVAELRDALQRGDGAGRAAAAHALAGLGAEARLAAPELEQALTQGAPALRAAAAWALGAVGAAEAVPVLATALRDTEAGVRAGAAWSLGRLGAAGAPACPALALRLSDSSDIVRWRAGEALPRVVTGADCLPALRPVLEDAASPGRAAAAGAVGAMGVAGGDGEAPLAAALTDSRSEVRLRAAWALGQLGPAAAPAVPLLVAALGQAETRATAAEALGGIGPLAAEAVPALIAALHDDSSAVRWRVAKAIGRLGPAARAASPALATALDDAQENVRLAAVRSLAKVEPPQAIAIPSFGHALHDADSRVRREAAADLGALGPAASDCVPSLIDVLADEDAFVRAAAVRALGRIAPASSDVARALERALSDPDEAVRREARAAKQAGV